MTTKAEAVYSALLADIEGGLLLPGAPLAEEALVARLGASRTPVRAALQRLLDAGLAERSPGRGVMVVAPLSVDDVDDLFAVRQVLEPEAFRKIAAGIACGAVDAAPLRVLMTDLDALGEAAPDDAFFAWAERFDTEVARLTPNRLLARAILQHRPLSRRARGVAHRSSGRVASSRDEHRGLLEALLSGDPDAAGAACSAHLEGVRRIVANALEHDGGAP